MVPTFVLKYLPHGIKAAIFAAVLAAAMSSLDSALNSLSASTMRDFVERYLVPEGSRKGLLLGKAVTVGWGIVIIIFAFMLGGQDTVVERINKVGSAFYGPILAAFLAGVTLPRVNARGIFTGILTGVGVNVSLWIGLEQVFWMWWNLIGCAVAMGVAFVVSLATPPPGPERVEGLVLWETDIWGQEKRWVPIYVLLLAYFAGMLAVCYFAPDILRSLAGPGSTPEV
jgi:SSS family solute:Na+ symporter